MTNLRLTLWDIEEPERFTRAWPLRPPEESRAKVGTPREIAERISKESRYSIDFPDDHLYRAMVVHKIEAELTRAQEERDKLAEALRECLDSKHSLATGRIARAALAELEKQSTLTP